MAAQQQSMAAQADPMAGADPAAEEDAMTEEMLKGGLVDRRQRGGCRKGQPCAAYDGGRGPKMPKRKKTRKSTGFKTRVRGRAKFQSGGSCGPGGCGAYDYDHSKGKKRAKKIRTRSRKTTNTRKTRHWGRPKV